MLYATVLVGLLAVSNSQTCDWGPTSDDADTENGDLNLFSKDRGSGMFTRDGSQQYVVYDFAKTNPATDVRGQYFLPYLIANDSGVSYCHTYAFSTSTSVSFECSADGDTIYANEYLTSGSCRDTHLYQTIWWEKGYSPFFNELTGLPVSWAACNSTDACMAMNYTRSVVTEGTGSRYDFSCEGSTIGVSATLCVGSDCTSQACATVLAAVGADCIQTPNATTNNLLVSCDKNKKEAYLTTYYDATQATSGDDWDDYTVDHMCTNDGSSGFICNAYTATDECSLLFTLASGISIYGVYNECDENLSGAGSVTAPVMLLIAGALYAIFNQ